MKGVNSSLITLKCVLFLFFGAIGSLFPFLPRHMDEIIGLPKDDSILVSIIAALVATLGPLIAAPLADRLAGGVGGTPRSKTGRYLRVMIAICCVLATILYWLLLAIPQVRTATPNVSFTCNSNGGFILQDRCGLEKTCYNWGSSQRGSILVKNCNFTCNATSLYPWPVKNESRDNEELLMTTIIPPSAEDVSDEPAIKRNIGDYEDQYGLLEPEGAFPPPSNNDTAIYNPLPHMCYRNSSGGIVCEVFTKYSKPISFNLGLQPAMNENDTEDSCRYPFADEFRCPIFPATINISLNQYDGCDPVVICEVHDPYNNTDSLLEVSQCGYSNISFWLYLFIRSVADIFPAAAVTLLATAVVIATRETSTGRGDVGKQFAAGALGFGIFAPIVGGLGNGLFLNAMICFTVLMALAVIILLVDNKMPLSPPEWWWHTRCGLLALPMSSVRKYGLEIAALGVVLFLLGVFWNSIDTFLPWYVVWKEHPVPSLLIGFTLTVAAIPAVIFLYFAEKIVDYCGHSNILIVCFVSYICHHLALWGIVENVELLFACEWLEIFTLHIMYITAVLYLRHLVPRKFTACGQALPVIAHFCLGRCFGALFGGMAYTENKNNFYEVHQGFTIAAAVVAIVHFIVYHFYMKPKCAAPMHLPPDPAPAVIQSMNGNGSYTPLRVYHNSKSKKGHFRY